MSIDKKTTEDFNNDLISYAYELLPKIYNNVESNLKDNFNIFQILNLEYDEVRLHSRILKYFIEKDPCGFLSSIKDVLGNNSQEINNKLEKIEIEFPIYSSDSSIGYGRIDLLVKFRNFSIIIENKIFAKDQKYQLLKYHNFSKQLENKVFLLYLTPLGEAPDVESISFGEEVKNSSYQNLKVNEDFYLISYKNHILNWLNGYGEDKNENNSDQKILNQYIITLNKICGIMNEIQKTRIHNLLNNSNLSSQLFQIKNDIQTIENKIHEFWQIVAQKTEEKLSEYFADGLSIKEDSIMFHVFGKIRGNINFYLEYKPNFEDSPYIGIWLHKNYFEKLKPIIEEHNFQIEEGFINKIFIKEFFNEKIIVNYINGTYENDIDKIVGKINEYLHNKVDLIKDIKHKLT